MREVDVVYLYEHASRELDVACAVASILKYEYGVGVEILQWPVEFPRVLNKIRPRKLVVVPYCYSERDYAPLLAYWRNIHYFNLAWEQLFYEANAKTKTPRGEFALNVIFHHAWSQHNVDFLKGLGVPENHIFLNGQPAYSLYERPYKEYFSSREELASRYELDLKRQWIFFPENYNWAFYPVEKLKLFVREDQSLEDIYSMQEFCSNSLSQVLNWFFKLLEKKKDIEIIIRPRPYTLLSDFREAAEYILGQIPERLHIIQNESVREWILASDATISSYSTSLIEAAIAEKRAHILEPIAIPARLQVGWQNYLPHIQNYSEFEKEFLSSNSMFDDHRLGTWARKMMMSKGDSIRNVARHIVELMNIPVDMNPNISYSVWSFIPPKLWSFYRNLRQKIRYKDAGGVKPMHTKDLISQDEMILRQLKWRELIQGLRDK